MDFAGATDDRSGQKHLFFSPSKGPRLVILDPSLAATTPERIWLSTGVRAVDHCVEGMCSLVGATEQTIAASEKALGLLIPGLLRCAANRNDLEAILECQLGSAEAIGSVSVNKVSLGGSHAIGHQLGPLGVGHGETSCILLPAVCRFNLQHCDGLPQAATIHERQERARDFLLGNSTVQGVLRSRLPDFDTKKPDLAAILDAVFRQLRMPRSLSDLGVKLSPEQLDTLAEHSLTDIWCPTNPIPLTTKEPVLEILQQVV